MLLDRVQVIEKFLPLLGRQAGELANMLVERDLPFACRHEQVAEPDPVVAGRYGISTTVLDGDKLNAWLVFMFSHPPFIPIKLKLSNN